MIDVPSLRKFFAPFRIIQIYLKSIAVSFFISYFLFTLFSVIPGQQSHFTDYTNSIIADGEYETLGFINGQPIIFQKYITWFQHALTLDFGKRYKDGQDILFPILVSSLDISLKLIFISLFLGFLISMIFIILSTNPWISRNIIQPILTFSLFHLLIILAILFYICKLYNIPEIFAGYLGIVVGGGFLADYYSLLNSEYHKIINKDYILFADNAGFNKHKFAFTEILINFISITLSRIPILFGSMIILEVYKSGPGSNFSGIGYLIWRSIYPEGAGDPQYHVAYSATCILVLLFTFLFYANSHLKKSMSPKLSDH